MAGKFNPRARDTRSTDKIQALRSEMENAVNDSVVDEEYNISFVPVLADTEPDVYAHRQSVINNNGFWPDTPCPDEAWKNATMQVNVQMGLREAAEAVADNDLARRDIDPKALETNTLRQRPRSQKPLTDNEQRHGGAKGHIAKTLANVGDAIADLAEVGMPRGQAIKAINPTRGSRAYRF